jgi:Putative threonine efflux protein
MIANTAIEFLFIGSVLGLSAGISPGPLLTLVIAQTIKHNTREGIKIAISPLVTDFPILVFTFFVFSKIAQSNLLLGAISFLGSAFIAYLGYESIRTNGLEVANLNTSADSLKKGIVANFLSPHPYLFWATVGSPIAIKAFHLSLIALILFFTSFYMMLIGSKILIAILTGKTKSLINQKLYTTTMKVLGFILFSFSLVLFLDGLKYLNT